MMDVLLVLKFVICLTFLQNAESVNVLFEYILSSDITGDCGETISSKESVYVKSHVGAGLFGGITSYSADTDCDITFTAASGKKVLVLFPFFDLQAPDGATCLDRLQFYDGGIPSTSTASQQPTTLSTTSAPTSAGTTLTTTTGTATTTAAPTTTTTAAPTTTTTTAAPTTTTTTAVPTTTTTATTNTASTTTSAATTSTTAEATTTVPALYDTVCVKPASYTSTSNQLAIRFISDGSQEKKGFNLVVTSYHDGTCTASEFQCDTNRCISDTLKCDGVNHCLDASDEDADTAKCSTLDEVLSKATSLGSFAVLGIAIIVVLIIFTVVTVVLLWKYIGSNESCKASVEPEEYESVSEIIVTRVMEKKAPTPKKKKSVTIEVESGRSGKPMDAVDAKKRPKGVRGRGRVEQTPDDTSW